ncbi:AdoMet-dependent rRNA methyltransferase spb-1 [Annulohypoxylon truncatum]|uniref:AdoMet-dependent rRNA methyltransferase spb-1 n=1 Tax=Annulohypoxylon truncatum TaxID=327061 RepID=UPI0020087380|nr:AdoMet-dependent rRNA methyltransferase spb-1 [Annulohypoxylon truncatum]KAI1214603.1 AdoMet-dependent rRNA methyltransferase spb-1 [Annulohypoxylon truncatum]
MAIQKKHGKGRLDKWYKLAKEKGYRARAAFKLIQLNKKYGFLEKSKVLLDLCAAPGSWCQVAAEAMPANSLIVGVDLSPIKPIPKVITFQSDITTDKCRATIRQHLKTWKADTVLHDGAPNVGTAWVQDSFNQAELALQSMKLATEFLVEGGTFVTKVFRSKEYNKLLWVFNQLFTKVESTKPPSSRNVSAEIFVVCRGFKAPKHIDPQFLDPRAVFAELADSAPNNEAKVFKPEIKKRKRGGYEEGDYTQFKEIPASQFIETVDPIAILGNYNKLSFEQPRNGDVALAALDKMPDTTEEIRICCADLKVLGRREFKLLLKWRLKAREAFGLPTKKTTKPAEPEEVAEVEPMDEELKIQEELQALKDKDSAKKKRERRKENEKKQKEIVRMQLHMVAPMDIGMEQDGPSGHDSMFALKPIDKHGVANKIVKGKMAMINESKKDKDSGIGSSGDTDDESDEEEDRLERELDNMYDQYRERKAESDAKFRAKKARKEHDDGEWEGVSADEQQSSDDEVLDEDEDSSDNSDEDDAPSKPLLTDLDNQPTGSGGLSKRATNFFSQDIFKDIPGILDEPEADEMDVDEDEVPEVDKLTISTKKETKAKKEKSKKAKVEVPSESEDDDQDGFEVVKQDQDDDWEDQDKRRADGRLDIDIITAEAMTLAHQLATGQKTNYDVVDDGFNKHAFRDRDGLPDWFIDDESRHDKPQKPITKAAAAAIKEKTRALNARPIKKVREAKARKKFKAAQRLEKLKKKSDLLANEEGLTEKEKADSISRLLAKAAKKKPKQPAKLVVARGLNRGIKGRPKGVKGRYKIVDPRMKKELRAQKRIAKRK